MTISEVHEGDDMLDAMRCAVVAIKTQENKHRFLWFSKGKLTLLFDDGVKDE